MHSALLCVEKPPPSGSWVCTGPLASRTTCWPGGSWTEGRRGPRAGSSPRGRAAPALSDREQRSECFEYVLLYCMRCCSCRLVRFLRKSGSAALSPSPSSAVASPRQPAGSARPSRADIAASGAAGPSASSGRPSSRRSRSLDAVHASASRRNAAAAADMSDDINSDEDVEDSHRRPAGGGLIGRPAAAVASPSGGIPPASSFRKTNAAAVAATVGGRIAAGKERRAPERPPVAALRTRNNNWAGPQEENRPSMKTQIGKLDAFQPFVFITTFLILHLCVICDASMWCVFRLVSDRWCTARRASSRGGSQSSAERNKRESPSAVLEAAEQHWYRHAWR
jgi:hypothetical protein